MDDEYFGTLGGSLMKDLLADLQVDDNDWSIEQLEKELESYEKEPSILQQQPLPSLNAASLVVSHSQQRSSSLLPMLSPGSTMDSLPPPGMANNSAADAWSLSLQKFTDLSLQEDFLAADTARKQTTPRPPPGMAALMGAEDYDIKETQVMPLPPGLPPGIGGGSAPPQINNAPPLTEKAGAVAGLEPPPAKAEPASNPVPTVTNAFLAPPPNMMPPPQGRGMGGVPPMQGGYGMPPPQGPGMPPPMQRGYGMPMLPPQGSGMPGSPMQGGMGMPPPQGAVIPPPIQGGMGMPPVPRGVVTPQQGRIPGNQGMPPPPMGVPMPMAMNMPATMAAPIAPLTGVVVGAPVSTPGQAWQTPRPVVPMPVVPQPQPTKAFCNPYPRAPPIPATELASSCMSSRDIAYVVHAILRPVLAAGISENDYYIQYIKRRVGGPQADPVNPKRAQDATHDVASRTTKSKEWASEKSVLGHVTKSNVARPRALIATPQPTVDQENKEQRQRANLWKARVYCDQAYQAYQSVIDIWRASSSNGKGIPPQVQMHLVKLKKCMGIVLDKEKKEYVVSDEALKLIVKLEKGRTLISRVLEQALLPPNAVQALLPPLMDILMGLPSSSSDGEEKTIGRLFQAIAGIIPKLNFSGETLVECLEIALKHGKSSTGSMVRMGCLHSLLQKGAQVVPQDPSSEVKEAWGIAERKFVSGLQQ